MDKQEIPRIRTPFINLQSDFGFKRVFGTKKFRKCLLMFLNAALGDELQITDVNFHNRELP